MKKAHSIYTLLLSGLVLFSCSSKSQDPFADLETHEMGKVVGEIETVPGKYGEDFAEPKILLTQIPNLIKEVEEKGSVEATIQGEIQEVCTNKGCWFTMDLPNGESMRVTFKDYGFFVPTNSQGFPIILKGVATMTETDVDTQRHYAEDQGKSKEEIEMITEPKREITFEATGVIIEGKEA
ncbi:DUF4920 domain-containing protein [Algoriphagus zhangzhouensis]|uniref:DUF4920 domain-containing protein n=1 Tax=Algoriphagus zhangzhouensis TaxID=1073327 RepID=A0A1M7Z5K0_9BACT|nr:DUF4920 domain-containing protein [Algoriphagus zhangzhouensis]TDY48921.1 uncharacterized protein DUF4920 [Algoriphagus zhangzhouensis]SHO60161.1 protein of unknown function [Algoriphagus zhangzhouensis]